VADILLVSQTSRQTGFGRVAIGIANALAVEHRVTVIGVGPAQASETWTGQPIDPLDTACATALRQQLNFGHPDILILLGVGSLSAWQAERVRRMGYEGLLVAYVPVESWICNPRPLQGLHACTEVVAYHAAGAEALAAALSSSCAISWINHGVDSQRIPGHSQSRRALRLQRFPGLASRAEHTWVLNANRNDNRKAPELTLFAFASVVAKAPPTTLLMHCAPKRRGVDLRRLRDHLSLRNHVVFTHEILQPPWPEDDLTALYECCEIGVNSALAEGFGLIAFEHALCGGAQIMAAHHGLRELWDTAPAWVPLLERRCIDDVFVGEVPDSELFASELLRLLQRPCLVQANAAGCAARARETRFSWATVGGQWRDLASRLMGAAHSGHSELPAKTV
jgi:D-inositol-3-phosphate glycosyltransferase